MNLVLLFETDRIDERRFELRGERARHVLQVLELGVGDRLRVGLLCGGKGEARVVELSSERVTVEAELDVGREPRPPTDLLLAVPRPKSLKKLLPEVTALGLDRLLLFRSWRVDPAYLQAKLLEPEVHTPLLHAGLMQARSTEPPELEFHALFRPFVEDRLPALLRPGSRALISHPEAEARVADLTLGPDEHVVLGVGPEGGFIPYELDRFRERGFLPVSMGPRALRVETACVALLAQISLLRQQHVTGLTAV